MNVIWVTTSVPHPAGAGGDAHEFELIRTLAMRHQIHVIGRSSGELGPEPLLAAGATFTPVTWRVRPHPTNKLAIAAHLVRARPNLVTWLSRDLVDVLARAIDARAAESPPDLVVLTHGELCGVLERVRWPTALLLFDALTRAWQSRYDVEPLRRRRAQLRIETARTRAYERDAYSRAAAVASVSSVDAAWLQQLLERPVEVFENPIPDELYEPPVGQRSADDVVFVGALSHLPNTDAVRWLATEIWPRIAREARPQARLHVVGRRGVGDAFDDAAAAVHVAGGSLHLDVPDVRPHYWGAAAVVAPLRHGSGLRNKVLHAMACRAPVVATPAALEGVPAAAARHAWVAADAAAFADRVVEVLADPEGARREAEAAFAGVAPLRVDDVAERIDAWFRTIPSP